MTALDGKRLKTNAIKLVIYVTKPTYFTSSQRTWPDKTMGPDTASD